jgi:probable phosphoglycerate mutase
MIVEKYNGKNVLIVTHAGNVRVIDYYFNGKPKDYNFTRRTVIKNGGLLSFENPKI